MDPAFLEALDRAATLWGIEPEYWDIWGRKHTPAVPSKRTILEALGVPTGSLTDLTAALEHQQWQDWSRLVPATVVFTSGEFQDSIPISLASAEGETPVTVSIHSEASPPSTATYAPASLPFLEAHACRTETFERRALPLGPLPQGYHTVEVATPFRRSSLRLIIAPDRAYLPASLRNGGKAAGVAVSLFGLRSSRNWGCGDFQDLIDFVDWIAAERCGSFIALNPLHAIENRQPYNISPYLPTSAYLRNPLYLDVESVPDYDASFRPPEAEIESLRSSEYVEYERVWNLKRTVLVKAFLRFWRLDWRQKSLRARDFERFIAQKGVFLERFAVYCALWERIHAASPDVWIWPDWPEPFRDPDSPAVAQFRRRHPIRILFHQYLQWQVDLQLEAAHTHALDRGLPVGLYHDLALAVDRCGCDLWAYRPFFVSGCRVGSPPDAFSPDGQDWSFPPPNAVRQRDDGYRMFIESIRANVRHGGALRIDHVMRLFRLYWIPDADTPKNGAYVQDFHADLLKILALESVRNRVVIVGEDLGTVSDNVREELDRFGILSYKLLYFEKHHSGAFKEPDQYARQALVSSTTHDLATLAGYWTNRDIEARRRAGLSDDESYYHQLRDRIEDKQRLLDMLLRLDLLPGWFPSSAAQVPELTGELHNAVTGFLAMTPSMLLVLNQEDLTKETEQQNLPGSTWQYPNWRRKMRYTVEELRTHTQVKGFTAMFRNWLERSGRTP